MQILTPNIVRYLHLLTFVTCLNAPVKRATRKGSAKGLSRQVISKQGNIIIDVILSFVYVKLLISQLKEIIIVRTVMVEGMPKRK